ncbi:MAG: SDR family oxidoreductase [Eubacterium sp.]|nr:SDR family oxidoreductase [Eubacterium sp.]
MRKALVTGASRGIGKAVAEQMRLEGYEVYTPSRAELDLEDRLSVESYCIRCSDLAFDVLVNNAGINEPGQIDAISEQEMLSMVEINLLAPLRLTKALVLNMKKNHYGRIVNIGSIWGMAGKAGRVVYAATKHAIHGVTQTLAVELAPYNILVNTVCPGFTLTDLTWRNNSKEQIQQIVSSIPAGRMADPSEPAKLVCFLAGEHNTYITGQQIAVDGGYTSV